MYEKMYHILFHGVTEAMEQLEGHEYQAAMSALEQACREAEEVYITG